MTTTLPETTDTASIANRKLQLGELVNVHIQGARILRKDSTARLWLSLGGNDDVECYIPNGLSGQTARITVERVAPKEWPPQPGDVWADGDDGEWFAFRASKDGITLRPAADMAFWAVPGDLLLNHGPMRLVRRRGWTPDVADAEEVKRAQTQADKRAAVIAGLREFANFIEQHPDLPVDRITDGLWSPGRDALDAWAAACGVAVESSADGEGDIHHRARIRFGGIEFRPYVIEYVPKPPAPTGVEPADCCSDATDAEP